MEKKLKLGFCGSGRFAASCLSLISARIKPEWVITNAPKPSGRGMRITQTPVYEAAETLGINCFTTVRMSQDDERIEWIRENLPDLILVIDFGHIIKEPMLNMAEMGCMNIHPSMLPSYRGSAPVQRAIMDGLSETGVTLFRLDAGMDSGPILSQSKVTILPSDDFDTILEKCSIIGTDILLNFIFEVSTDKWNFTTQSEDNVSLAPKIDKTEGKILWDDTALNIYNKIRAIGASPGTYCTVNDKRIRVYRAVPVQQDGEPGTLLGIQEGMPVIACGIGALKLIEVQPEGKKKQSGDEWLRGSRMTTGNNIS